jgi:hypothetical protein
MRPDNTRPRVLETIKVPRTVPQIQRALPDVPRTKIENALHNACRRGQAVNLHSEVGRKCGGLFVVREEPQPIRPEFGALLEVWRL